MIVDRIVMWLFLACGIAFVIYDVAGGPSWAGAFGVAALAYSRIVQLEVRLERRGLL